MKNKLSDLRIKNYQLEQDLTNEQNKKLSHTINLSTQTKKESRTRKFCLLTSLLTAASTQIIPLIGVPFAAVSCALLIAVVIGAVKLFKYEDEVEKTKKEIEESDEKIANIIKEKNAIISLINEELRKIEYMESKGNKTGLSEIYIPNVYEIEDDTTNNTID